MYTYIYCIYVYVYYILMSCMYISICTHCILYNIYIYHILYKYMYIIYVKMYVNICICIHNMQGPVTPASMQHITWIINENSFCMVLRVFFQKTSRTKPKRTNPFNVKHPPGTVV